MVYFKISWISFIKNTYSITSLDYFELFETCPKTLKWSFYTAEFTATTFIKDCFSIFVSIFHVFFYAILS